MAREYKEGIQIKKNGVGWAMGMHCAADIDVVMSFRDGVPDRLVLEMQHQVVSYLRCLKSIH